MSHTAAPPRCTCCGRPRTPRPGFPGCYTGAHDWCLSCCKRWYRADRPPEGPPPPMSRAECAVLANTDRSSEAALRLAEYGRLRRIGCTPAQAALRVGVSPRDAGRRYERAYLTAQAPPAANAA